MSDITLTIGGTAKALTLTRQDGKKMWKVGEIPRTLARGPVSEVDYASLAADRELIFAQSDWIGGFGQGNYKDEDKYQDGSSIDTTQAGELFLGPLIQTATDLGSNPVSFETFIDNLYCATTSKVWQKTAATTFTKRFPSDWAASTAYSLGDYVSPTTENDYLYECTTAGTSGGTEPTWGTTLDGTTNDNTAVWTCRQIKQIKTFGDALYVATGNGKYLYSTDGSAYTTTTSADNDSDGFLSAPSADGYDNVMWKFETPNAVLANITPKDDASTTWTSYTIGDASADITAIMLLGDNLLVGREDNLYWLDVSSVVHPLMDELKTSQSANNFKYIAYWQACLYFSLGSRIGEVTTGNAFSLVGPYEQLEEFSIKGTCCGLTADRDWIYAFMDDGTNTYCYKGRESLKDNSLRWEWCPWINLSTNACQTAYVFQPSTGNAELWFGYADTPAKVVLSDHPLADTAYKVATQGYIITGWFDAKFRTWDKLLEAINCECYGWDIDAQTVANLSANVKVTITYEKDDAGSYIALGAYTATNNKSLATKKYLSAVTNYKKVRFKIQLDSNDNTITPIVKLFSSHGHLRPEYVKLYDFTVDCSETRNTLSKTIRDFLVGGRTSTSLITLKDRFKSSSYIVFLPGFPEEIEILDEVTKQSTVVMHIMAIGVDWA